MNELVASVGTPETAMSTGAQRLSASRMNELIERHGPIELDKSAQRLSASRMNERRMSESAPSVTQVLNAFRHHG